MLPSLQRAYHASTMLRFCSPAIESLYDTLKNLNPNNIIKSKETIDFKKSIVLKNLNFKYPNSSNLTLKNINIEIQHKKIIGLVGPTGSGKTTLVDVILGILTPQDGTLQVDGKIINNNNLRSWQNNIGYLPQIIYLSDDTIAKNIAFGVNSEEINQEALERAAKIANLHNFITTELPEKYNTTVGERGIRLSGGQRQRIGIARALYHNPKILILDEATSALDNDTEKAVMEAINNLENDITIILIAHRLTTIKKCDEIIKIEKGSIVAKGKFEEVDVERVVQQVEDAGINVMANYIYGLPGDTPETIEKTYNLSERLNTLGWNTYAAMALPGSPLYAQAKRKGVALPEKYEEFSFHSFETLPLPTEKMDASEILKTRDKNFTRYFSRPEFLQKIRSAFGQEAVDNIKAMNRKTLKRKIVEKSD